jgi:hypothetical protein
MDFMPYISSAREPSNVKITQIDINILVTLFVISTLFHNFVATKHHAYGTTN